MPDRPRLEGMSWSSRPESARRERLEMLHAVASQGIGECPDWLLVSLERFRPAVTARNRMEGWEFDL